MTRVCLVGADDVDLRAELTASETARDALSSYELRTPYANCVAVDTISIGAAVSVLNDLNWYLRRYAADALVLEPSVSEAEWLSRSLATAIRNERVEPDETGTFLKIYGVVEAGQTGEETDAAAGGAGTDEAAGDAGTDENDEDGRPVGGAEPDWTDGNDEEDGAPDGGDTEGTDERGPPALAEPLFARRVGGETPAYDLREVDDTLVVRVTAEEFGA